MPGLMQTDENTDESYLHNDNDIVTSLFGNIFLLIMFVGFILSIAIYLISYFITDGTSQDSLRGIALIILGAIIASVIHEKVLGDYYKNQSLNIVKTALYPNLKTIETKVIDEIAQIAPNVKEETISSIKDIQERVTEATQYMLNGIGVLSGAKAAGIQVIFPTRYEEVAGETFISVVKQDFLEEKDQIKLRAAHPALKGGVCFGAARPVFRISEIFESLLPRVP